MVVVVQRGQGGGGPVPHSPVKTVQPSAQPHRLLRGKYSQTKSLTEVVNFRLT